MNVETPVGSLGIGCILHNDTYPIFNDFAQEYSSCEWKKYRNGTIFNGGNCLKLPPNYHIHLPANQDEPIKYVLQLDVISIYTSIDKMELLCIVVGSDMLVKAYVRDVLKTPHEVRSIMPYSPIVAIGEIVGPHEFDISKVYNLSSSICYNHYWVCKDCSSRSVTPVNPNGKEESKLKCVNCNSKKHNHRRRCTTHNRGSCFKSTKGATNERKE